MTEPSTDEFLTPHQQPVVTADGNFFLLACPGSGKTRAASARIADRIVRGQTIAACSYTNVGADAIARSITGDLSTPIPPGAYCGTLHAFLLRYVFYPFGHLATNSTRSPSILRDESRQWPEVTLGSPQFRVKIAGFRFRPDGSVRWPGRLPIGVASEDRVVRLGGRAAVAAKIAAARRGLVSADDAMYWALRVLREHPAIAASVARRFGEVVIDEAQDTSELQLACVAALRATGALASLVLVGDLDQSIYSFQGASREGCAALAASCGLSDIRLTENHRSSQRLCDTAARFRPTGSADLAVGPNAGLDWDPELLTYDHSDVRTAVEQFRSRLASRGIEELKAAVLARSNGVCDAINGEPEQHIDARPRALVAAGARIYARQTLTRRELEGLEGVIAHVAWGLDLPQVAQSDRELLREAAVTLLGSLPAATGSLRDWVRAAAGTVGTICGTLADPLAHRTGEAIRTREGHGRVNVVDAFAPGSPSLRAQTIHDVKGETIEAVLVIADPAAATARRAQQATVWSRPLRGETVPDDEAEELRVLFVALTRAEKYLALAVPDNAARGAIDAFIAAGFRPSRDTE